MSNHGQYVAAVTDYMHSQLPFPVLIVPSSNGFGVPTKDKALRQAVGRVVNAMKRNKEMLPGAADLAFFWKGANDIALACFAEIKTGRDKQSPAQEEFEQNAWTVAAAYFLIFDKTWSQDADEMIKHILESVK